MPQHHSTTLPVALGERQYNIVIGTRLLAEAGMHVKNLFPGQKVFIVTDENVAKAHLMMLTQSLDAQAIRYHTIILPAGEQSKSFSMLEQLLNQLLAERPERKNVLIAFGGGVIGDLVGFAASILLRGVPFIQVPTTLLAQVDSSVGGKTAVNTAYGKNLVGTFYQPRLVLADIDVLSTLPEREFWAGYAEVVKYGLIRDAGFFVWLEKNKEAIKSRNSQALVKAVEVSCACKAEIVAEDEREGGVRALLNLGHTFGHALEAECGYDGTLLHGEAVAIGMVQAYQLAQLRGMCTENDVNLVKKHLQSVGLPVSPQDIMPDWNTDRLISHMYQDKKVQDGKLVFIVPKGIGDAAIVKDIREEEVRAVLAKH